MIQITLKAARINAELKQSEAAERLGVALKSLQNYENGKTAIPAHVLREAANVYGIEEDFIRIPIVDDGRYNEKRRKNLRKTTV